MEPTQQHNTNVTPNGVTIIMQILWNHVLILEALLQAHTVLCPPPPSRLVLLCLVQILDSIVCERS
jgi:hypothetical protein